MKMGRTPIILQLLCSVLIASCLVSQSVAQSPECGQLTVSGFPNTCLLSPCDGCDLSSADLNGVYTRLSDVTDQFKNTAAPSDGKYPVYATQNGKGIFYLFWDSFYQSSTRGNPGETPGWAIGRSVGSVCSDDRSACSCGFTPPSCCKDATGCDRYLVKSTKDLTGKCMSVGFQGNPESFDTSTGFEMVNVFSYFSVNNGYRCAESSRVTRSTDVQITCSDASAAPISMHGSGGLNVSETACQLGGDRCDTCDGSAPPVTSAPTPPTTGAPTAACTEDGGSCSDKNIGGECCSGTCSGSRRRGFKCAASGGDGGGCVPSGGSCNLGTCCTRCNKKLGRCK